MAIAPKRVRSNKISQALATSGFPRFISDARRKGMASRQRRNMSSVSGRESSRALTNVAMVTKQIEAQSISKIPRIFIVPPSISSPSSFGFSSPDKSYGEIYTLDKLKTDFFFLWKAIEKM